MSYECEFQAICSNGHYNGSAGDWYDPGNPEWEEKARHTCHMCVPTCRYCEAPIVWSNQVDLTDGCEGEGHIDVSFLRTGREILYYVHQYVNGSPYHYGPEYRVPNEADLERIRELITEEYEARVRAREAEGEDCCSRTLAEDPELRPCETGECPYK